MKNNEFTDGRHLWKKIPLSLLAMLDALEGLIPHFLKVGGKVHECEAWDDWEDLVQQMFDSFVVHTCTDSGDYGLLASFHRLGFEASFGSGERIFVASRNGKEYFLQNIVSPDSENVVTMWEPILDDISDNSTFFQTRGLSELENFRIGKL